MYIRNPNERSLLTIMIYLNNQSKNSHSKDQQIDGFTGGSTFFLNEDYLPIKEIIPKTGLGLIFYQESSDLLHEGAPLLSGTKYIMRCDVMYLKTDLKDVDIESKKQNKKSDLLVPSRGTLAILGALALGIGVFIGYRILSSKSKFKSNSRIGNSEI